MSHEVNRTFHPVGQGAFYSERHVVDERQKFSIVYDCGNLGHIAEARSAVVGAFNANEQIDILFISHFDTDHVARVKDLKPYPSRIKNVVLPLLNDEVSAALVGYYRSTADKRGRSGLQLAMDILERPYEVFPESTIIYVRPDEVLLGEFPETARDRPRVTVIDSGADVLRYTNGVGAGALSTAEWTLRTYNYDWQVRSQQLIGLLNAWLGQIRATMVDLRDPRFVEKHRTELRYIYKGEICKLCTRYRLNYCAFCNAGRVTGDINDNSMVLYSGPSQSNSHRYVKLGSSGDEEGFEPGCLYTGDYNLNQKSLNIVYAPYINRIGTSQIPHHGASSSFVAQNIPLRGMVCPISHGYKYGHPNQSVITGINATGGRDIQVTFNPATEYRQEIIRL